MVGHMGRELLTAMVCLCEEAAILDKSVYY